MVLATVLAGFGMPALGALVFIVTLVIAVTCWILVSPDRCGRVYRILLAIRGDPSCLAPELVASPPKRQQPRRRPGPRRQLTSVDTYRNWRSARQLQGDRRRKDHSFVQELPELPQNIGRCDEVRQAPAETTSAI